MTRTDADTETGEVVTRSPDVTVIAPRDVPLGGPRAMTVRRALPSRERTTIGAWCFLDHYGPDPVSATGGMSVPPHPHTGLQTVSWLFEGEIEHRDSTGVQALVRPGELNLMTAGSGIQHSEVSTPSTTVLHGVQLWVVLPERAANQSPHFDARSSKKARLGDATVRLFLGSLAGVGLITAPTYTRLLAAQVDLPAGGVVTLDVNPGCEHGILVDHGSVSLCDTVIPGHHLGVLDTGHSSLTLTAGDGPARVLLLGGEPFTEDIVMWWNFIGRSHDDIERARAEWQDGLEHGSARFGHLDHMPALPAPTLPTVRLKARGNPRPGQPQ